MAKLPARSRPSRRPLVLGVVIGAVTTLVLALLLAPALLLTHREDLPFERAYAGVMVGVVSRVMAGDAKNPVAGDARAILAGRAAYTGQCAMCHGAAGDGRGVFGPSTYPDAADLTSDGTRGKSDAQLFWIIKNGLGFTAMPAFGQVYRDPELWAIVAYLRELQRGAGRPMQVPGPTEADLARADPHGDVRARGAAIFFAQGCFMCHGGDPTASGDNSLAGRLGAQAARAPDPGMPRYGTDRITDAELRDLEAFLVSLIR